MGPYLLVLHGVSSTYHIKGAQQVLMDKCTDETRFHLKIRPSGAYVNPDRHTAVC